MVLQITEQAKHHMIEMLKYEDNDRLRLRLGVKDEGCNGLSYSLGFDQEYDEQLDCLADINGIPVIIKKADVNLVTGTIIDFKQNMMGGAFTVDNPHAVHACNCGPSIKTDQRECVSQRF